MRRVCGTPLTTASCCRDLLRARAQIATEDDVAAKESEHDSACGQKSSQNSVCALNTLAMVFTILH
eukprot:6081661-Pleurochrysis_carterae.AAC.1